MEEFGRAMLNSLPGDAIVVSEGDDFTNPLRYVQMCENVRPDVVILDRQLLKSVWYVPAARRAYPQVEFPGLFYSWFDVFGAFSLKDFFDANLRSRPVFLDYVTLLPSADRVKSDDSWLEKYELLPHGYFFEVVPQGGSYDPEALMRLHRIAKAGFEPPSVGDRTVRAGSSQENLSVFSWDVDFITVTYVMKRLAMRRTNSEGYYHVSANYLTEQIARKEPLRENPIQVLRNLCRLYIDWQQQYPVDFAPSAQQGKTACRAFINHPMAAKDAELGGVQQWLGRLK